MFGWWNARIGSRNVSFERVNSGGFDITSASNISIIGGQVGPQHSGYDPQINSGDDADQPDQHSHRRGPFFTTYSARPRPITPSVFRSVQG